MFLLIAAGLSNVEIATRLFLSEGGLKAHVRRIVAKWQLRERVRQSFSPTTPG